MIKHKSNDERIEEAKGKTCVVFILAPCKHNKTEKCTGPIGMYCEEDGSESVSVLYLCEYHANELVLKNDDSL